VGYIRPRYFFGSLGFSGTDAADETIDVAIALGFGGNFRPFSLTDDADAELFRLLKFRSGARSRNN
jgi:hypothetical protein